MTRNLFKIAALSAATLLLSGCSSSSSSGSSENLAAYVGNWSSGCIASPIPEADRFFFDFQLAVTATEWTLIQAVYVDDACTSQSSGTEDAGTVTGTTTISAVYTDAGETISADGLSADTLTSTFTEFTSTLDEPDAEVNEAVGTTGNILVYVDDMDQLFVDQAIVGLAEEGTSLLLTVPFSRVE